MKSKKYNWIFLILGLGALIYMVWSIGLIEIWDNIRKTGWWFIPIVGIWFFVYIINNFSWSAIIHSDKNDKRKVPFWKLFRITISGFAINYITPVVALGGEPYRIFELQRYLDGKKATSSVILYSMMHILSHFVFWMASVVLIIVYVQPEWAMTLILLGIFLFFAFVVYIIFRGYKRGLFVKTIDFLTKIPLLRKFMRKFREKQLENLVVLDEQVVNLHKNNKKAFYTALMGEFTARVVSCLEYYFIAKAVAYDMTFIDAIIVYAGSTLVANVLFFSPMQLGTREGGLALSFKSISMPADLGIYVGIITRIREAVWILIGMILIRQTSKKDNVTPKDAVQGKIPVQKEKGRELFEG